MEDGEEANRPLEGGEATIYAPANVAMRKNDGSCAGSLILVTDLRQQVYHPISGGIPDGWTISSVLWIGEPA